MLNQYMISIWYMTSMLKYDQSLHLWSSCFHCIHTFYNCICDLNEFLIPFLSSGTGKKAKIVSAEAAMAVAEVAEDEEEAELDDEVEVDEVLLPVLS